MMSRTMLAFALILGLAACSDSGTDQQTSDNQTPPAAEANPNATSNDGTAPAQ